VILNTLDCVFAGEILTIHVKTQPADKEKHIVTMLQKLLPMSKEFEEMSDEEKNVARDLVQQLQAVIVGACVTESILLFTHVFTTDILQSIHEMFDSGQLTEVVRDLFRCLSKDKDLTVEVEIGAELFQECENGFADDGK